MRTHFLLALLIYGLVFAGLGTRTGELLLLAIPPVLYLAAGLVARPDTLHLKATRALSAAYAAPGQPVTVTVTLTNLGHALDEIEIADPLPAGLTITGGHPRLLTGLPAGAAVELSYTLNGRRGLYRFSGIRVTVRDSFGLVSRQTDIPAPGRFVILPQVTRLKRVEIRPRQTRVYSGQIPARQGGPGVEFFGVREYQPGDPLRWINSRASARHPANLYINQFEQERVADVGLILDAREQSDARSSNGSLFEYAVQATATLAHTFLNAGNRVGLFIYGRSLDWTYPGYGKLQQERIMRALARAELGGGHVFEKLEHLPTRLFPARSQLVLVSPLLPGDAELLVKLRARGYRLLVVSPDPVTFERSRLGHTAEVEQAARLARLERRLVLARLRQAGIRVVDWQVGTPFPQAASAALSRFKR